MSTLEPPPGSSQAKPGDPVVPGQERRARLEDPHAGVGRHLLRAGESSGNRGEERQAGRRGELRARPDDPDPGVGRHLRGDGEGARIRGEERHVGRRGEQRARPEDPDPGVGRHLRGDGEGIRIGGEERIGGQHRRHKPAMVGFWRLTMDPNFWETPSSSDSTLKVSAQLSETLVKLESDVLGRSSAPVESASERQSEYCPTWFSDSWNYNQSESESSEGLRNVISDYNAFLWQGPGGLKRAPTLPENLSPVKSCRGQNKPRDGTGTSSDVLTRSPMAASSLTIMERTLR